MYAVLILFRTLFGVGCETDDWLLAQVQVHRFDMMCMCFLEQLLQNNY